MYMQLYILEYDIKYTRYALIKAILYRYVVYIISCFKKFPLGRGRGG